MAYVDHTDPPMYGSSDKASELLKKYKEAKGIKDYWKDRFEEAYEYCLPNI